MHNLQLTNIIKSYYATDFFIADKVVEVNPAIQKLVERHGYTRGGKYKVLTLNDWKPFAEVLRTSPAITYSGGSSSNIMRTMSRLGGADLVRGIIIGVLGTSDSDVIYKSFKGLGIKPIYIHGDEPSETATSLIIKYPDTERIITTYPGNARQILKPEVYKESLIAQADDVIMQGSILSKLDENVFYEIMKHRWNYTKKLILAEPTTAFRPQYFEKLQTSADILLSNTDELGHVMGFPIAQIRAEIDKDKKKQKNNGQEDPILKAQLANAIEGCLISLQRQQARIDNAYPGSNQILRRIGHDPQEAMITDDVNGAYLVTSEGFELIPAIPDEKIIKVNKLGAGDNAFAGFIFARENLGWSAHESGRFAMVVAAAKLQFDGPVMDNPLAEIRKIDPVMADKVEARIKELLAQIGLGGLAR